MNIIIDRNGKELEVSVEGRLNTLTSPELEEQLEEALEDTEKLIFNFEKLDYISSSGLRVLLSAIKEIDSQGGETILKNVNQKIMDVFEVTGLTNALTIE